ncbi:MAG: hypothetical protein ACRC5H_05245 [Treponemataceae bacterium]
MNLEKQSLLTYYHSLLQEQRKNLLDYTFVLEKQYASIIKNNYDVFCNQIQLAEQILLRINALNKVVHSIKEQLLLHNFENSFIQPQEQELRILVNNILLQNQKNRFLLQEKMTEVHAELKKVQKKSYHVDHNFASIIDLHI